MRKVQLSVIAGALALVLSPNFTKAQDPFEVPYDHCGTKRANDEAMLRHPELLLEREALRQHTKEFTENYATSVKRQQYVIPVVFHIHDPSNPYKVTMDQINSAMQILNEDYNAANADLNEVYPNFQSRVADFGITFALAKKDPDGNPTNGVTYHYDELEGRNDQQKAVTSWPAKNYLNIWICNYPEAPDDWSAYRSGWTYYPWTAYADYGYDGVVYNHRYLGYAYGSSEITGPNGFQGYMPRVLTHEVGHFLNLMHTFENYCSAPGDEVDDTPAVYYHGSGSCNAHYDGTQISYCSGVTETNLNNYMDYSHCPKMYTEGQKVRALAALTSHVGYRNNLWTTQNLIATGLGEFVGIEEEKDVFYEMNIYPIPSKGETTLDFGLLQAGEVHIELQDVLGRTVETLASQSYATGKHRITFNTAPLNSGIYFVNLQQQGRQKNIKFIVE